MTTVCVEIECYECNELFNVDDIYVKCEECAEKYEASEEKENGNALLTEVFSQWDLEGECIVGFSSKEEKEEYLRVRNLGIMDAAFEVAEFFGLTEKWEEMSQEHLQQKINAVWPDQE